MKKDREKINEILQDYCVNSGAKGRSLALGALDEYCDSIREEYNEQLEKAFDSGKEFQEDQQKRREMGEIAYKEKLKKEQEEKLAPMSFT